MAEPTPTIGWRKREDGMWVIWDLPNGAEYAPLPPVEQRRKIDEVEERWGTLCREIGSRHLLPDGWLQAMIWRESGGNPRARNPEGTPDPGNDGIGLLQITSKALKGNRTDEELFDPRTNIEIGARYISWLASLPNIKGDFPKVAAAFNAGSVVPTLKNRWGMVHTTGHVDSEVQALNYWTATQAARLRQAAGAAVAAQFNLQDTLESGHVTLMDDDEAAKTPRNT